MDKHNDLKFIEKLFFEQISNLTKGTNNKIIASNNDTFSVQHSDLWL